MVTSVQLYHKFLKLMRHSAALVPTLAIDLIWHTHMQFPVRYAIDCVAIVGHQVDHDDDDEGALDSGFEHTSNMWQTALIERHT